MGKSVLTEYIEENYNNKGKTPNILPLFHSCEYSAADGIIEKKVIEKRMCPVFKEELVYYFYGIPAYPVWGKRGNVKNNADYLPVCFIVKTQNVAAHKVYPFDTGAQRSGRYDAYIGRYYPKEDFELNNSIDGILKYISVVFGNNENYLKGRSVVKQSDDNRRSVNSLIEMINTSRDDARCKTVEVMAAKDLNIKTDVECIILAKEMLNNKFFREEIDKLGICIKTYRSSGCLRFRKYNDIILELANEYIEESMVNYGK